MSFVNNGVGIAITGSIDSFLAGYEAGFPDAVAVAKHSDRIYRSR